MASDPTLDIAALTKPIPGDNPAGLPIPLYEIKETFEEMRTEIDPEALSEDDPQREEKAKKADWKGIKKLAIEMLESRSKDLHLVARLTEALLKLNSFGGLRDGLRLFYELVENCWDRLNPPIEDGDMERRATAFYWLDDATRRNSFPNSVRMVPFLFHKGKDKVVRISLLDRKKIIQGRGPITNDELDKAIEVMPLEASKTLLEDLDQCLGNLNKLTTSLNGRMGSQNAPGMTGLRPAIEECRGVIAEIVKRKVGSAPDAPATGGANQGPGQPGSALTTVAGSASSRAEVYRYLKNAAALLKQLEPHSPIPYLIQRAVELGSLPFPELIKALIRDANVLNELTREFGLPQAEAGTPPAS